MLNHGGGWWWRGPAAGDRWLALAPMAFTFFVPLIGGDVVLPFGIVFALAPIGLIALPTEELPELTLIFGFDVAALAATWGAWLLVFRGGPALRALIAPIAILLCFGPLYWWRILALFRE